MCKTTTRPWSLPLRPRSVGVNYDIYPHTNIVVEAAEWVLRVRNVGYHFYLHLTGVQVVSLPYLLFTLLCYFIIIIIICFNSLYSILFVYLLAFPRVLPWESLDVRCTWHTKMPWWSIAPEATAFKHRDLMKKVFFFGNNMGGRIFYTTGRFSWKYATVL